MPPGPVELEKKNVKSSFAASLSNEYLLPVTVKNDPSL